ncbi:hypothetical protein Ataiwa_30830 [Algoriphagus taiwanensis]|uniref:Uncharacterized protein n=1 Tax=Algoriphagus taiwanensis TaxID=1445656 RepID=A0ABQ6Q5F8_9BACT|nr:hypothetical protein Ataiwa_30830 [Algoriphagus taiwanensis]
MISLLQWSKSEKHMDGKDEVVRQKAEKNYEVRFTNYEGLR